MNIVATFNATPNIGLDNLLNTPVPIPVLGTLGYVYDSNTKFDKLISHAFLATDRQTQLYYKQVTSIPALFQLGAGNINTLQETLKDYLYSYFNRYYENVNLTISIIRDTGNTDSSLVTLSLKITFTENGIPVSYSRTKAISLDNLNTIASINNYGT